ncbi:Histidine kinase osmosensor [Teratosphaeriaceae sp. CCFEE 6253]|nr:Histidine kinase osmosensor [Teratosphaeriaceae sp. CCFEE 6253]
MRISIRAQLGLLILLSSLIGLMVVSVATWISNHNFVLAIRSSRLSLTASLKAAQLASNLNLMQTSANFITTRVLIQSALMRYETQANNSAENWARAYADMADAISGGGSVGQALLLQSRVFPKDASGAAGSESLMNTTSSAINNTIRLPYDCPDGTPAYLGDGICGALNWGFPPMLYPNLTYATEYYNATFDVQDAMFAGDTIRPGSALLIGPWQVNSTFSLVSMTMPVVNNTSAVEVLGWLTVVMDASLIMDVVASTQGLDQTGQTLLLGPSTPSNTFPSSSGVLYNTRGDGPAPEDFEVRYVLPVNSSDKMRHPDHVPGTANLPFEASRYPAVVRGLAQDNNQQDNSGAMIKTHNEAGKKVSVGFAVPQQSIVDWVILVEQAQSEVWQPIDRLRNILLACVFATAALMALIAFPLAHVFSLPIRRLREATARSMEPPGASPSRSSFDSLRSEYDGPREVPGEGGEEEEEVGGALAQARKEGYRNPVSQWQQRRRDDREKRREDKRRRAFKIPGKVKERRGFVKDELSDLTSTFNEMSDELMMQYERLEERVQQRTAELEHSKKAAEAANESKTLFIANISHELKTPLNGILGMTALCLHEDDPGRLKRSLGIIYKSGDLLLNLLTDLLTFSKNQVGQHLTLDEKEFALREVSSQLLAIFDKQAKEGNINLRVEYEGVHGLEDDAQSPERNYPDPVQYGPAGTGRLKNMILWGDVHRILQVVINLVSNALKFTPAGGSVVVTIRTLPEMPDLGSRKGSMNSRQSRQHSSRQAGYKGSDASLATAKLDTANAINAKDKPHAMAMMAHHERAASPPPGRYIYVEFEVADTGPGIPESMQHKIFEPFVQADLGLSKKYGGTGLGLSICTQLASLMRGGMRVQSVLGQGSAFTMKIPIRHVQSRADSTASSAVDLTEGGLGRRQSMDDGERTPARHSRRQQADEHEGATGTSTAETSGAGTPNVGSTESQPRLVGLSQPFFAASQPMESPGSQPAAMEKMTAEATRGGRIRVLVAEDNKVNQEVVLRMLKLEDIYDVTVAKDGQEALDRVRESMLAGGAQQPYNLIFMDVQMPNVDGLTSTKMIREIGYQAPIVALTAFAEESNIKDCYDSGMNYFLSKPIRRPQLKKVLKEYCAPIPEEAEDITPPETHLGSPNTTIVMVNSAAPKTLATQTPAAVVSGKAAPLQAQAAVPGLVKLQQDGAGAGSGAGSASEPVSPFST